VHLCRASTAFVPGYIVDQSIPTQAPNLVDTGVIWSAGLNRFGIENESFLYEENINQFASALAEVRKRSVLKRPWQGELGHLIELRNQYFHVPTASWRREGKTTSYTVWVRDSLDMAESKNPMCMRGKFPNAENRKSHLPLGVHVAIDTRRRATSEPPEGNAGMKRRWDWLEGP